MLQSCKARDGEKDKVSRRFPLSILKSVVFPLAQPAHDLPAPEDHCGLCDGKMVLNSFRLAFLMSSPASLVFFCFFFNPESPLSCLESSSESFSLDKINPAWCFAEAQRSRLGVQLETLSCSCLSTSLLFPIYSSAPPPPHCPPSPSPSLIISTRSTPSSSPFSLFLSRCVDERSGSS